MRALLVKLFCAIICLSTASFAAVIVQVGGCLNNLANYPTISLAVNDVPAGSTIEVCPGIYPEQVTITLPLTLKGITTGGSSAAVVALPSTLQTFSGLAGNGQVAAQILVQSAGGNVTIENLVIDGSTGSSFNFNFLAGIYYLDSSGVISNVAVRNQSAGGVQGSSFLYEGGYAVVLDSEAAAENVTVGNSALNATNSGVWGSAGVGISANIRSNFIDGLNANQGISLSNAGGPVTGTVSSNTISGFADGLLLQHTTVTATANTIHGGGMEIVGGSNTIERNSIDAGVARGVQLYGTGANVVEFNTIVNSLEAIYGCNNLALGFQGATGDTVSNNTILNSTFGIELEPGNTSTANKFNLVSTETQACF